MHASQLPSLLTVTILLHIATLKASEVALLALAAMGPKEGISAGYVLILPAMFAVGMSLIDTLDGMMMVWAYGWAMIHPVRQISECFANVGIFFFFFFFF
jgi:high-affinity nickel permease